MRILDLLCSSCVASALCAAGCSHPSDAHESGVAAAPIAVAAHSEPTSNSRPAPKRPPRASTPELVELRRMLSLGRTEEARARVSSRIGSECERALFEARFSALQGATLDALRWIENARQLDPDDPEVYATAAEIYAGKDSVDSAWGEIRQGLERCGETAELLRAKGVVWLCREGGAEKGMEFLEAARARDPDVAYLERPLSQAHLLLGKLAARDRKFAVSLDHARLAASLDPSDIDARRFLSEALAATSEFDASIAVLEDLIREGEPLEAELASRHKQAAIVALLARRRDEALQHFVLARQHGLDAEGLGSGARLLTEAALEEVRVGVDAYERGERDVAERAFRRALELDPDEIQARNHLAVVTFQRQSYSEARDLWAGVLELAERENLELPDPVHINLAKAQVKLGDASAARSTLEHYLAHDPHGEWVEPTRAMLDELERAAAPR